MADKKFYSGCECFRNTPLMSFREYLKATKNLDYPQIQKLSDSKYLSLYLQWATYYSNARKKLRNRV